MRGSEKQIKWAEEIKANLVKTYTNAKPLMAEQDARGMDAMIEMLNKIEYAGDIISVYKGIRFTGDVNKDFDAICSTHRITPKAEIAKFLPTAW